jgi:CDP-glycerol glycerophosphotransferase (TagB/SpsB family)
VSNLAPYAFSQGQIDHLGSLARDQGAVIGIREPVSDLHRAYSTAFGDLAVDVSPHRFGSLSVVLRATDALLTDYDGSALDFTVTGRPVVSFAHDLISAGDHLLYDLDHLFPGPVCRDFESLAATLATVFDPPAAASVRQYNRVRDLLIDHRDGLNSARAVERVRELLDGSNR